jgi:hypothetical protein
MNTAQGFQGFTGYLPESRLERHPSRPLSHRRRPGTHRRVRTDCQRDLRRRDFPSQLPRGQCPGGLSAAVGHVDIRLGAVERLGATTDGAQYRRSAGRRRHPEFLRRQRTATARRRPVCLQCPCARLAQDRRNPATLKAAGMARRLLAPSTNRWQPKDALLFAENCAGCHVPRQTQEGERWVQHLHMLPVDVIGTDPGAANNIANHRFDLSALQWEPSLSRWTSSCIQNPRSRWI